MGWYEHNFDNENIICLKWEHEHVYSHVNSNMFLIEYTEENEFYSKVSHYSIPLQRQVIFHCPFSLHVFRIGEARELLRRGGELRGRHSLWLVHLIGLSIKDLSCIDLSLNAPFSQLFTQWSHIFAFSINIFQQNHPNFANCSEISNIRFCAISYSYHNTNPYLYSFYTRWANAPSQEGT